MNAKTNFTKTPKIILIIGLLTCLYAWSIALVIVIIDERKIDIPNKDNRGAVYSISLVWDENNKVKIGLLKTEIPSPAGNEIIAVNFIDVAITDLSFLWSLEFIAEVNSGTRGKAIAVTKVAGKL